MVRMEKPRDRHENMRNATLASIGAMFIALFLYIASAGPVAAYLIPESSKYFRVIYGPLRLGLDATGTLDAYRTYFRWWQTAGTTTTKTATGPAATKRKRLP